jgi:TolB protein
MSNANEITSAITLLQQGKYRDALNIFDVIPSNSDDWKNNRQEIFNALLKRFFKDQISEEILHKYHKLFLEKGDNAYATAISRLIGNNNNDEKEKSLLSKFIAFGSKVINGCIFAKEVIEILGLGKVFAALSLKIKVAISVTIAVAVVTTTVVINVIPRPQRIVYMSNEDGDFEIYLINEDGTDKQQLTDNNSYDAHPSWSPDGKSIIFVSNHDGDYEIYSITLDTKKVRQLTNNTYYDDFPQVSPNGKLVIFNSDQGGGPDGNLEIFVMDILGLNQRPVTMNINDNYWPTWLNDNEILFASDNLNSHKIHNIYTMQINNPLSEKLLLQHPGDNIDPIVSPDGKKIAFISDQDQNGTYELFLANSDGIGINSIFQNPAFFGKNSLTIVHPDWLPSSDQLLITVCDNAPWTEISGFENTCDLYIVNADGTGEPRKIEINAHNDEGGAEWEP